MSHELNINPYLYGQLKELAKKLSSSDNEQKSSKEADKLIFNVISPISKHDTWDITLKYLNRIPPGAYITLDFKTPVNSKARSLSLFDTAHRHLHMNRYKRQFIELWNDKRVQEGISVKISKERVRFAIPHFCVPKGDSYRVVGDFRELNSHIKKVTCYNTDFLILLQFAHQFPYVYKIDLESAFDSIPILPEYQGYFSYYTPSGWHCYTHGGQGFVNFPAIFSQCITAAIVKLNRMFYGEYLFLNFQDDIFIFSHRETCPLTKVEAEIDSFGFTVNHGESSFHPNDCSFLGYYIRGEKIFSQLNAVPPFPDLSLSREKQVQIVRGRFNYDRWLNPHTHYLNLDLTRWRLGEIQSLDPHIIPAFPLVVNRAPLAYIHFDASDYGWAAILYSQEGLALYYLSYVYYPLNTWKRYPPFKKELKGLTLLFNTLYIYFSYALQPIIIYTDSLPLSLFHESEKNGILLDKLNRYKARFPNIELQWISGENNTADYLSRPHLSIEDARRLAIKKRRRNSSSVTEDADV